ncbi:DUF2628 domain-containing protein [Ferrovibrio sp.]|uniref:DUF2628 domain-containing protein n=1 Tax=Ferrovibrio sp. TaxID=1917215 RepID=UPI0035B316F5
MRFFSIHMRPGQSPVGAAAAMQDRTFMQIVPSGFSWIAALFTPVWLIWHRQWWGLAGYVGLMLALGVVYAVLDIADPADWLIGIALAFLFGASAAELRRWTLDRNGWQMRAVVAARDAAEAHLLYTREIAVRQAASLGDRMSDDLGVLPHQSPARAPGQSSGQSPARAPGRGLAGEISALPRLV